MEKSRVQALESYAIIGTPPEKEYDSIAKIASEICRLPIAQITVIDSTKQYTKSSFGIEHNVIPRDLSFCNDTIKNPFEITIIPNMLTDDRFKEHPGVINAPFIKFYAGVPLTNQEGFALGSLCVMDHSPRELSAHQIEALKALAAQVVDNLDLRRKNLVLKKKEDELQRRYNSLEQFSGVVSHDLKSPLNSIIGLTNLLRNKFVHNFMDYETTQYLDHLDQSCNRLKFFINGLLEYYGRDQFNKPIVEQFDLVPFLHNVAALSDPLKQVRFNFPNIAISIFTNRPALQQILHNLFTNAIKYNDKKCIIIDVILEDDDDFYYFTVRDNGMGISENEINKLFMIFNNLEKRDRHGNFGTGIGLSIVKKLVEAEGGNITVSSIPAKGTKFTFTLTKPARH